MSPSIIFSLVKNLEKRVEAIETSLTNHKDFSKKQTNNIINAVQMKMTQIDNDIKNIMEMLEK